jgi:hypothetical protein
MDKGVVRMNRTVLLGGFIIDHEGNRIQLPADRDPPRYNVECALRTIATSSRGVLTARREPPPDAGPFELTIYVETGSFAAMLSTLEGDGDVGVRTLNRRSSRGHPNVEIFGEMYPSNCVTNDTQAIQIILCQFIETGDVDPEWMD